MTSQCTGVSEESLPRSMAEHVMKFLDEIRGDPYAASKLIEELADMYPSLASISSERFHLLDDRFDFADIELLTGNVDPLVIAVLRKHEVVKTTWDLARTLDAEKNLTTGGAAEVSLRAAATAALEDMAWSPACEAWDGVLVPWLVVEGVG
eukprot:Skav219789  [mRNA]  locus=scaffold3701:110057:111504:+ [translate_table: standard]